MECLLSELWRKSVTIGLISFLLVNLSSNIKVTKAEYLHKNTTDSSNDTTPPPAMPRSRTTQQNKENELGCHCNLPKCVAMGYMCKSALGACFTRNTPTPTHAYTRSRKIYHRRAPMNGCVELLQKEAQQQCLETNDTGNIKSEVDDRSVKTLSQNSTHKKDPELTCCHEDMCNYRDIDVYINVQTNYDSQTDTNRRDSEIVETLWFRAATIAVPIAGGFILIILVLLASRILSKENKRHRMAQVIGERYLKTPLYPGGSSEPLPHLPLYYHAPLSKTPSLSQSSNRTSFEEKPCHYRPPDIHICSLEEIKPLNINNRERDRETDSPPLPS